MDRIAAADAALSYSLFPEEGRPVDDHVHAGGGLPLPGHDREEFLAVGRHDPATSPSRGEPRFEQRTRRTVDEGAVFRGDINGHDRCGTCSIGGVWSVRIEQFFAI